MSKKKSTIKELVALSNYLDKRGLTKEADQLDRIIRKEAFLLGLIFGLGCQGKGGLNYNHFLWSIDPDSASFISTAEQNMISNKTVMYTIVDSGDETNPNNGVKIIGMEVTVRGLSDFLTSGSSVCHEDGVTYDYIQEGIVYEDLENFEKGRGDLPQVFMQNIYSGSPNEITLIFSTINNGILALSDYKSLDELKQYIAETAEGTAFHGQSSITIEEEDISK